MNIIVLGILLIVFIILIIWYLLRKRWAIKKVKCTSEEEKIIQFNAAINPFGFEYDSSQDIVVSQKDCWQRDYGYMDLYDLKAPYLNMVFDAEPIYFEYDCKEYRIEFWKGQYGITTGAEVGVYVRDKNSDMPSSFYRSANDDECLDIDFKLIKKCNLFCRCDKSWWLTGFKVGLFSHPKDLIMSVCICFTNEDMKEAFIKALIKRGYSYTNICVCDNTVCFDYCCPHNYKLNKSHRKCIAQICNYINCHVYNFFTRFFYSTLDKFTYIRFMFPHLYHFVIKISIPRRKKKHYQKKII